jgi:rhodanese-related sulfurtransferase
LTELQSGDSFGEEALLTNAKHNASVTMLTDGVLMKLSKENFINLIEQPVIKAVSFHKASVLVASGATWLDVRLNNEHVASHIKGSINIPFNVLRMESGKLKSDKRYVIYCDTGIRSSAAAFLLTKRGYNVYYLEDGLMSLPQSGVLPENSMPDGQQRGEENKVGEKDALLKRPGGEGRTFENAYQASDVVSLNLLEQDTEKTRKFKQEADKRLEKEKRKFEEIFEQNAREMEKLRQLKKNAEERLNKEREELQEQFEKSRLALEKEAEKKHAEQEAMEKAMQNRIKAMLEQERGKLAKEIVRANQEVKLNRREEAITSAARKAINKEAKIIIEEFKKEYEQERAAEQARLDEEHRNLEQVSRKIRETLKEIQKTRKKAEEIWRAAETDAGKLRENQQRLESEIRAAEIKLAQARMNVEEVQQTENSIAVAQEVNELEFLKQKEGELRKKVEAEITVWKEEHEHDLEVPENILSELKRMKEHAEAAKRTAEKRAKDLISDIAAQIWKR